MQQKIKNTRSKVDEMMRLAGLHLYTGMGVYTLRNRMSAYEAGWSGGEPDRESRAPWIGPFKGSELLNMPSTTTFAMSPAVGYGPSTGYMGGVLKRIQDERWLAFGSAFSEKADTLIALQMMWMVENNSFMNHFGQAYDDREAWLRGVHAAEEALGGDVKAIHMPADDHDRYYLPLPSHVSPTHTVYVEFQLFDELKTPRIHWEIFCDEPENLLLYLGENLSTEPKWFDDPTGPVGKVGVMNRDGVEYGIMARGTWFTPSAS